MKKEQVLIVEDDADMLLWKRKMEDRGFIV